MSTHCQDYAAIVREIKTSAVVSVPVRLAKANVTPVQVNALWDTGAMHSVISDKIIEALKLEPYDQIDAYGVNGWYKTPVFLVDLLLPNGMQVVRLAVSRGDLIASDMLIGMDVISLGDMMLTNSGFTKFSFRIPAEGDNPFVVGCPSQAKPSTDTCRP